MERVFAEIAALPRVSDTRDAWAVTDLVDPEMAAQVLRTCASPDDYRAAMGLHVLAETLDAVPAAVAAAREDGRDIARAGCDDDMNGASGCPADAVRSRGEYLAGMIEEFTQDGSIAGEALENALVVAVAAISVAARRRSPDSPLYQASYQPELWLRLSRSGGGL